MCMSYSLFVAFLSSSFHSDNVGAFLRKLAVFTILVPSAIF